MGVGIGGGAWRSVCCGGWGRRGAVAWRSGGQGIVAGGHGLNSLQWLSITNIEDCRSLGNLFGWGMPDRPGKAGWIFTRGFCIMNLDALDFLPLAFGLAQMPGFSCFWLCASTKIFGQPR